MSLNPVYIEANDLSDAFFQTIYKILEVGREFIIDRGSFAGQKRLEFDYYTCRIKYPGTLPLLPKINPLLGLPDPVAEGYLDEYLPYLMTGAEKPGESYTYGSRICNTPFEFLEQIGDNSRIMIKEREVFADKKIVTSKYDQTKDGADLFSDIHFLNQMELMIWTYKNKGPRNNQMVLQIAQPSDMLLQDSPCLREIDTRIQDGKLHFFPQFRSNDMWGGFPANLAAIELMKQYCAAEIGVESGEIIYSSKGAHIYDHVWEIAEAVRGKSVDEFREEARYRDDQSNVPPPPPEPEQPQLQSSFEDFKRPLGDKPTDKSVSKEHDYCDYPDEILNIM
jgi:thymidylate synthase